MSASGRLFFFVEGPVEQLKHLRFAEHLRPRAEGAVRGDLEVLRLLRRAIRPASLTGSSASRPATFSPSLMSPLMLSLVSAFGF